MVEILIDLILKALYKANKNKKVKVKSPDTEEKDETTQTSNTSNSKTAAVGSMILLQKMLIFDRSTTFVKESCFGRSRILSYACLKFG